MDSFPLPREKRWLDDVPVLADKKDTRVPLWSVQRAVDGSVDVAAERKRCSLLVEAVDRLTSGQGAKLRYRDLRFSFDDPHPPTSAEAAAFLRDVEKKRYRSPLAHDAWEMDLWQHPDRLRVALLLDMIRSGANIGYDGPRDRSYFPPNHGSAVADSEWLSADFEKDLASGRVLGWFDKPPFEHFRCSPLATVPKLDAGVKVGTRRILDCSSPAGESLNDYIQRLECRCVDFEAAVAMIASAGPGALLGKFDVDAAFRVITVRSDDLALLGFEHLGRFAFDSVCSFGARTSPPLWERVASALNWVLVRVDKIERVVHWVDDFLLVFAKSEDAKAGFAAALARCVRLGIPVKDSKTIWPCIELPFAGFLFNTVAGTISVTEQRRSYILSLLRDAQELKVMPVKQLQSLLGRLHFVSRVLPAGRGFVNRLLTALHERRGKRGVSVSDEMRRDFAWWLKVLPDWSGVSLIAKPDWVLSDSDKLEIYTDASEFGMGGFFGSCWFSEPWTDSERAVAFRKSRVSMPYLELRALVRAAEHWGHLWTGKRIAFRCDCLPIVHALNRGTTRMPAMAALLRTICELSVVHGFEFRAVHVDGVLNTRADPLSRGVLQGLSLDPLKRFPLTAL